MTPSIILFDLDNTLYDYNSAHSVAIKEVKSKATNYFNIKPKEFDSFFLKAKKEVKKQLQSSAASHNRLLYFQKLFEIKGLGPQVYHSLDFEQTYWNSFLIEMKLHDGVLELLDEIRLKGIKCGLITDLTANIQFRKLIRLGLEDKFDVITTSEEIGHDKPHPDCFRLTMNKILNRKDYKDENIWMIGDDLEKDIKGAITNLEAQGFWYKGNKKDNMVISNKKITVFDNFHTLITKLQ